MPEWSPEQRNAFTLNNRNLLVSAAAGSGKTAVLIERIMQRVFSETNPSDIDRLLVTTFTKAAAANMKEKIHKRIFEKCEEEPENKNYRRQLTLLSHASIGTLDSFCATIFKNYFHTIDEDPIYRQPTETELALVEEDVRNKVLEEKYEANTETFRNLLETLIGEKKNDETVADAVQKVYKASQNAVDPEEWLNNCRKFYEIETEEELGASAFFKEWKKQTALYLSGTISQLEEALSALNNEPNLEPENPKSYYAKWNTFLQTKKETAERFYAVLSDEQSSFQDISGALQSAKEDFAGGRAPRATTDVSKALKETVSPSLEKAKEAFDKITGLSIEETLTEIRKVKPIINELISIVSEYTKQLDLEKRKRHIFDFTDIAHLAYRILIRNGERTEIARTLSDYYDEILVDEYQDINAIQEAILVALSHEGTDKPNNIFRVGDIKQSIYQFRMAVPDLFREKYEQYPNYDNTDEDSQKIELSANYRSRSAVAESVNFFCHAFMKKEIGGVEYTDAVELRARSPLFRDENGNNTDEDRHKTVLAVIDYKNDTRVSGEAEEPETEESQPAEPIEDDKASAEGRYMASEIRNLVDNRFMVTEETGTRKINYSDIVVLVRTTSDVETYRNIFDLYDIPSYAIQKKGFYSSMEIQLVLDFLAAVDNPLKDEKLAASLLSPIFKFTDEELAKIRTNDNKTALFRSLQHFHWKEKESENVENKELAAKIERVFNTLTEYRVYAEENEISLCLRKLYAENGLYNYLISLPSGKQRKLNLDLLLEKADEFEKTSYHGIYPFVRYIEVQKRQETDEGAADTTDEKDNVVRILTIHASKGLEYPVVFLAGLYKGYNKGNLEEAPDIKIRSKLGIGMKLLDFDTRVLSETFYSEVINGKIQEEERGEELRLLYVAMTRAKEKLYLVGSVELNPDKGETREGLLGPGRLSPYDVLNAKTRLELFLKAYTPDAPVSLQFVGKNELGRTTNSPQDDSIKCPERGVLIPYLCLYPTKEGLTQLHDNLDYNYRYDDLRDISESVSVSFLKMADMHEGDPESTASVRTETIPFYKKSQITRYFSGENRDRQEYGKSIGTLYHKVMEHINFTRDSGSELDRLQREGLISAEEKGKIDESKISAFSESDIAHRFVNAQTAFREKQFIIGLPVSEINIYREKNANPDELVMVQGVIDMAFLEEDGFVLVDYKTDNVKTGQELIDRYKTQMDYYEKALRMLFGKEVKERYLYSFKLGEFVRL